MKVSFSPVRVHSIQPNYNINNNQTNSIRPAYSNSERLGPVVRISFRGNADKQAHQFASFSAEDKGLGLKIYNEGGEAVVVQEQANSWGKHLDADYRAFLPYHAPNNPEGKIKVVYGLSVDANGNPIHPSNYTISEKQIKEVDTDYVLQKGESFIVQDLVNEGQSKYLPLEKTEIHGKINRLSTTKFEVKAEPYHVFKVLEPRPNKGVSKYLIYTPSMAKTAGCYKDPKTGTGKAYSAGADDLYATISKIFARILPQFNNEKHGHFNPANILLHDRQAYPAAIEISERSANGDKYYTGQITHSILHNSGPDYQGLSDNGLEFLRKVATQDILDNLEKIPNYKELKAIDEARFSEGGATKAQIKRANEILRPFLQTFIDDDGKYSLMQISTSAVEANNEVSKIGTVSPHFEYEMLHSRAMSGGFYGAINRVKKNYPNSVVSIVNGSTPANMQLGEQYAQFGKGENGFSTPAVQEGFTTFKYAEDGSVNPQQILEAKKANTKWLLNHIAEAAKDEGTLDTPSGLQKLFFNENQINKDKSTIIGQLSHYEEGDKLIMGWGRADEQKGMAATVQSFLKFLKDPEVPTEVKKKTKLLAGAGVWKDKEIDEAFIDDWSNIKKFIDEIQKLDGGIYSKNVMYVNGFFPNRVAASATHALFTSRYEPCGITPLESYATGTPVTSIKTGGAPNFVQDGVSGFLTKTEYLVDAEKVGKSATDTTRAIDDARREVITDDLARCIKKAILLSDEDYAKMVTAAITQKVDWHENNAYNGGMSANDRYMNEIFELEVKEKKITGFAKPRKQGKMKAIIPSVAEVISAIGEAISNATDSATKAVKSTSWGKTLLILAGVGAAGFGAVAYVKKQKQNKLSSNQSTIVSSQPTIDTNNQSLENLVNSKPLYAGNVPAVFNKIA